MRHLAFEIIGFAGTQHAHKIAHGHFDFAFHHHAALLAFMQQHAFASVGARRHDLAQDAHLPLRAMLANQEIVDAVAAHVRQFRCTVERAVGQADIHVQGEEVGQ